MDYIKEQEIEDVVCQTLEELGYSKMNNDFNFIDKSQIINFDLLKNQLIKINSNLELVYIEQAIKEIRNLVSDNQTSSKIKINKLTLDFLQNGIGVQIPNLNNGRRLNVSLIDYSNIENNVFNYGRQLTFWCENSSDIRPDILIYLNGIPLVIIEMKSFTAKEGLIDAKDQIIHYCNKKKEFYWWNLFSIVSNGINSLMGPINEKRWLEWKQSSVDDIKAEIENYENYKNWIIGPLSKKNLIKLIQFYIHYSSKDIKYIPAYHQFFCVEKCINNLLHSKNKGGVVWHTQGSGKTITMLFLTKQILQLSNEKYKIVFLTDRNELDDQLFQNFLANRDYLICEPVQIESRNDLVEILSKDNNFGIYMTTIQKFCESTSLLSDKSNIIVIADEAHRSHNNIEIQEDIDYQNNEIFEQKGFAYYLRQAFPNATFFGFTGTPLREHKTEKIFGDVIDSYNMTQAEQDGAVVEIKYERRPIYLSYKDEQEKENILNNIYNEYFENNENEYINAAQKSKIKAEIGRLSKIFDNNENIKPIVTDFWYHYNSRKDILNGKAMFVVLNRNIAVKIYKEMIKQNPSYEDKIEIVMSGGNKDSEELISLTHSKQKIKEITTEFQKSESKIKILIVVDMLLTGYDVPDLDTIYLFKILKWHNLMQAIARVNRIFNKDNKEKLSGLVVDYLSNARNLEFALSEYSGISSKSNSDLFSINNSKNKLIDTLSEIRSEFFSKDDCLEKWLELTKCSSDIRMKYIGAGINIIENLDNDSKNKFFKQLNKAKKLILEAKSLIDVKIEQEYNFYAFIKRIIRRDKVEDSIYLEDLIEKLSQITNELIDIKTLEFDQTEIKKVNSLKEFSSWIQQKIKNKENTQLDKLKVIERTKEQINNFKSTHPMKANELSDILKKLIEKVNDKLMSVDELLEHISNLTDEMQKILDVGEFLPHKELLPLYTVITSDEVVSKLSNFNKNNQEDVLEILSDIEKILRQFTWKEGWSTNQQIREKANAEIMRMLLKKYNYPPKNSRETSRLLVDEINKTITINKTAKDFWMKKE